MNIGNLSPGRIGIYLILTILISLVSGPATVSALTADESARQARLQEELEKVEKDIAEQTKLLQGKQKETASIQRDVDVLTYKISTAKLNIRAKQLQIERLGSDIVKKETTIGDLSSKIDREKTSLAELLRRARELDDSSVMEATLSGNTMSDIFSDLTAFHFIQSSLHKSFDVIRETKQTTQVQKVSLEGQRDATLNAKAAIEEETRKVQSLEKQKKDLLANSKNQENNYKKVLADRQKKKSEILSALFALRDTKAIPFEQALAYAKEASGKTGVRPAFVLAIMTQETNLGANVGTCNRPGDPVEKSWMNIMKPTRDLEPYKRIVKALGITPETMPLSCPQGNGYGGAMGPSQFIPSTWELYQGRIGNVTGHIPPSPWNAEDAFAASSIYLMDLGAGAATYTAEYRAAAKYYAGSRWETAGLGYANSVMAIAERIQGNIDYLQSI